MANSRRPADTIDLVNLRRDKLQRVLYDLFIQHFAAINGNLAVTVISRKYEMRLDMLCSDLYGSVEYIGSLMKINDIFNPFSVKLGDIIFYLQSGNLLDADYTDPKYISQQKDALVNAIKTSTIPKDRLQFLESLNKPTNLPPTIAKSDSPKIMLQNNKITIAPDLFANPANKLGTIDSAPGVNSGVNSGVDSGVGGIFDGVTSKKLGQELATDFDVNLAAKAKQALDEQALDDTERILVSRIIRSGNAIIGNEDINNDNN
ncbi:MAG: hypothetical protein ACC656_07465 [Candidatus Heimdallarchaeota archaeon]